MYKQNKKLIFTHGSKSDYNNLAVAKSIAERDNSNLLQAETTPKFKAFFISKNCLSDMVTCVRQRSIVGCLPVVAVCHPSIRYRPTTNKAVTLINLTTGVTNHA